MPVTNRKRSNIGFVAMTLIMLISSPCMIFGQKKISFGLHADPLISWFGSNISSIKNDGARSGFKFGITFNKYFTPNYSISTGLNLASSSGRLVSSDTTVLELSNIAYRTTQVLPDKPVVYKIQYISVPVGLKMQTNQIGYLSFFSDVGIDPKVITGGHLDIPSNDIKHESAPGELRLFTMGYHITGGIEYGLGGNTAFVVGLGFENNFLDITKDHSDQPVDRISHKMLSFRMGIIF